MHGIIAPRPVGFGKVHRPVGNIVDAPVAVLVVEPALGIEASEVVAVRGLSDARAHHLLQLAKALNQLVMGHLFEIGCIVDMRVPHVNPVQRYVADAPAGGGA